MKTLIAIPSKARSETLAKYSLAWLHLLPDTIPWRVFIEPQDVAEYDAVLTPDQYVVLPENNQGLGYSKEHIKQYAIDNFYDVVFKMDDDVRGFTDFRRRTTPEETAKLLAHLIPQWGQMFEVFPTLGAIAFPYRNELYDRTEWERTKRLQTAYLIRVSCMHADRRVSTFEDFAAGLYALTRGYFLQKYGLVGLDLGVKVGGGTGGLQKFNRKELALKELDRLREIYPPLTYRVVDKPWEIEPDIRSVKL